MAASSSPSTGKKVPYFVTSTGKVGKDKNLAEWERVNPKKFWNPGKSKNTFGKKL